MGKREQRGEEVCSCSRVGKKLACAVLKVAGRSGSVSLVSWCSHVTSDSLSPATTKLEIKGLGSKPLTSLDLGSYVLRFFVILSDRLSQNGIK